MLNPMVFSSTGISAPWPMENRNAGAPEQRGIFCGILRLGQRFPEPDRS
jgi:hypothetical protein